MSELTTAQAAERLEVGASTVRLWCQQGRFPSARAEHTARGDVWLIPEDEVKNFSKPKRGRVPKPKAEATTKQASKKGGEK